SPSPEMANRVLLPFLDEPFDAALAAGRFGLIHTGGTFAVTYAERKFPIAPKNYGMILDRALGDLQARVPSASAELAELRSIRAAPAELPASAHGDHEHAVRCTQPKESIKRRLDALSKQSTLARATLDRAVAHWNSPDGDSECRERMRR